jgi:hypothetical protein
VVRVDLQNLLHAEGVWHSVGGGEGLGPGDSLHVGRVAVLASDDGAGVVDQPLGNGHSLDLVADDALPPSRKRVVNLLQLLRLPSLHFVLRELEVSFGNVHQFFLFVLSQMLHGIFVNGIVQQ